MTSYRVSNTTSGHVFGTYDADSELGAIAAMCRDAGYDVDVIDGEIVFPPSAPETARDLSDVEAEETSITSITVREALDPSGLGDPSGCDADWQEQVCDSIRAEIESVLGEQYPDAELDIEIRIAAPGQVKRRSVEADGATPAEYERLCERVQHAGERGFDLAYGH